MSKSVESRWEDQKTFTADRIIRISVPRIPCLGSRIRRWGHVFLYHSMSWHSLEWTAKCTSVILLAFYLTSCKKQKQKLMYRRRQAVNSAKLNITLFYFKRTTTTDTLSLNTVFLRSRKPVAWDQKPPKHPSNTMAWSENPPPNLASREAVSPHPFDLAIFLPWTVFFDLLSETLAGHT